MKRWIAVSLMIFSLLSTGCAVRYRNDYRDRYSDHHRDHDRDSDHDRSNYRR